MDVSLLSVTTTFFIGASCFAIGYFLANAPGGNSSRRLISWVSSAVRSQANARASPPQGAEHLEGDEDGDADQPQPQQQGRRARSTQQQQQQKPSILEIESLAQVLEDFKMVLVVRNDLKMGKGKIAAQCSHATLGLYKKLLHRAPKALSRWEMCGQVKVVLKSESEEELLVLHGRAKSLKLPTHVTIDAGRTQIAPNSRTVMAILGPADVVDDVTGGLKLL